VCIEESKSPVFLSDFWSSYQLSGYEEINGQMYHSLFRLGSETTLKGSTVKLDKGTIIELGARVSINK
jgi:hypothetical protein